ncbi:peptidoglycan-binding domain-containing protein [Stackebrandtia nassauensis]|uniref:Peptidoglycan-binding domain 1 protein n=1 Tax=Stackebrandtia nassauensis (strain DSM 44728 / CIP 108903 / NRRL B-16338 / NBRC 102104 / LLR-40K-21) TaxID=446470 RepID=D3PYW6_STANL|nr:peptidoglycan-binding domain-containing protein [Stackebrandtia nassauensis]ADD43549.1 Peptidoglycan-binding domain 1 protein [Stackebrandtia nassauensis DSM 44728]
MANPDPDKITDEMWQLWTECEQVISGVRLGGIWADKPGYHNTVDANQANWPDNYSIQLGLDLESPHTKARAIDLTMSDAQMRLHTGRLRAAALDGDPRLSAVREFYGTLDSQNVYGLIKDSTTGSWRSSSSDSSHLWHIHISVFTTFVNDWDSLAPIVSVLADSEGDDDVIGLKKGNSGERVKGLQAALGRAGYPVDVDGEYGPKTAAALLEMRKDMGSSAENGDKVTGYAYAQLLSALAKKQAG